MSARLTKAIRIGEYARAMQRRTLTIPDHGFGGSDKMSDGQHVGVEPMLLALSMELSLKAWWVFDHDDPHVTKIHDLAALFDSLKPESQQKLDAEFRRLIAPYYPGFYIDYGIRDILFKHRNAFVEWRYMHETKSAHFEQGAFSATLEIVLTEFEKRYRVESARMTWAS